MNATPPNPTKLPDVLVQLKEVKSEAAELRSFTITFLSLLLYVNLIIAGTSAEQILRIAPVTLPLLNVPLPIIGFYGFLPWLLLFFHLYLLVQHYLFSQQLFSFDDALKNATAEEQAYARKNLGNLPFLHWMTGKHRSSMQFVLTLITLVCLIVWPLTTLLWLQMAILPFHSESLIWWQRAAIILDVLLVGWLWPKTLDSKDSSVAWWWSGTRGAGYALVFLPICLLWVVCRIPVLQARFGIQPLSLWQIVKSALPSALNASALALGLAVALFLSLAVATLPDSWEERFITHDVNSKMPEFADWHSLIAENRKRLKPTYSFWLKTVDVDERVGPIRMAFAPTAWLHEQHAKLFDQNIEQEKQQYDEWYAKGAKPCPRSEKPNEKIETLCLMMQPLLPRNLILREKILTADAGLEPELEARLQADMSDGMKTEASLKVKMNGEAGQLETKQSMPDVLAQIRGLDLQNRNLDYADFTGSSLPKVNLRYVSLKHAVLHKTRLEQAQLRSAHLDQVDLSDAKLPGVDLSLAKLPGADLSFAILPGADLSGTELPGANLYMAKLPGANLSKAELPGANLYGAELSGANLARAKLSGALLFGAELSGSDLQEAELSGADLEQAKLHGADLSYAKLPGADLSGAELHGANMSYSKLLGTDMSHAKLPGVDLARAELFGAILQGAELSGAYLAFAVLSGADLSDANLPGAVLLVEASSLSEVGVIQATDQYRKGLALQFGFKGEQQQLENAVKAFKQRMRQAPDFSHVKELKPCLRKADAKKLLSDCISEDALDENSRKALANVWVHLACNDETEGHWVARQMVERAKDSYFPWFSKPLLKVVQDPKTCPGLAGLSKDNKTRMQTVISK